MILAAATATDTPALAVLHAESFARPWTAVELAATAASVGVSTLIARAPVGASSLAGFVMWRVVLDEAEILTLAVATHARRGGIGAALIEAAASAARFAGAAVLWLEVAEDNVAALALYATTRFVSVGRRRDYYRREGHAVDALVLRRSLTIASV